MMISENIKRLRNENGLTQKDLAEKLFVTAQAVSRWENGEVEPSITTVTQIAQIFNVSVDEIVGNPVEKPEPEVIVKKEYVYNEEVKPVLGVCETCNRPIYDPDEIVRHNGRSKHIYCKQCDEKKKEEEKQERINKSISRRKKSFWIGGAVALAWIAFTIFVAVSSKNGSMVFPNIIIGISAFTLISCCLLANNFIGSMVITIFSWGFVKMPGVIFTLDLDGIIWLLTVKLFGFLLGIALALICGAFAIILGGVLSIFTYPFAIYKNYKKPEEIEL